MNHLNSYRVVPPIKYIKCWFISIPLTKDTLHRGFLKMGIPPVLIHFIPPLGIHHGKPHVYLPLNLLDWSTQPGAPKNIKHPSRNCLLENFSTSLGPQNQGVLTGFWTLSLERIPSNENRQDPQHVGHGLLEQLTQAAWGPTLGTAESWSFP